MNSRGKVLSYVIIPDLKPTHLLAYAQKTESSPFSSPKIHLQQEPMTWNPHPMNREKNKERINTYEQDCKDQIIS